MKSRFKRFFTQNIAIKILSIIIAILIWVTIVNISDPVKTVTIYNIPVTITDQKVLTEKGETYDVVSDQDINISISGKRFLVSSLSDDDFKATASLADLSSVNAIPITVRAKDNSVQKRINIVDKSESTVKVKIEKLVTMSYPVQVKYTGSTAENYVAISETTSVDHVKVRAPESVHNMIGKVAALCNLHDADKDFTKKCRLVILDKEDKVIAPKHTKISRKKVKVSVHLGQTKTVPIRVTTKSKPPKGYKIKSVKLSQNTVKLVGDSDILKDVKELHIKSKAKLSNKKKTTKVLINMLKSLPDGTAINGNNALTVTYVITKK